jgi:hypothetical protein
MKLIRRIFKQTCWCCKGTGIYKENSHIIIFGKQAIDSDNIG